MKIILVRHGKPTFDLRTKIAPKSLINLIQAYDAAGIENASHPSEELRKLIQTSCKIFTSDLPRSLESAARLSQKQSTSSSLFREIPVPYTIPYPFPLRAISWAVIGRTLWYLGYTGGIESRSQARDRATQAARQLISHASDEGPVALIGHGVMNMFIAKSLTQHGWRSPKKMIHRHWSWMVFQNNSEESKR